MQEVGAVKKKLSSRRAGAGIKRSYGIGQGIENINTGLRRKLEDNHHDNNVEDEDKEDEDEEDEDEEMDDAT